MTFVESEENIFGIAEISSVSVDWVTPLLDVNVVAEEFVFYE